MSEIRIVATIVAKANETEYVKNATKSIVELSKKEEGCIRYELHEDINNPNVFVFFEVWKDQQSVDKHNESIHFKELGEKLKDKVDVLDVKILSKIA